MCIFPYIQLPWEIHLLWLLCTSQYTSKLCSSSSEKNSLLQCDVSFEDQLIVCLSCPLLAHCPNGTVWNQWCHHVSSWVEGKENCWVCNVALLFFGSWMYNSLVFCNYQWSLKTFRLRTNSVPLELVQFDRCLKFCFPIPEGTADSNHFKESTKSDTVCTVALHGLLLFLDCYGQLSSKGYQLLPPRMIRHLEFGEEK